MSENTLSIPVKLGKCPLCKNRIFNEKGQPLPNQCQFRIYLSNNTETDVGMCRSCFSTVTDEQVERIFAGVKAWWQEHGFMYGDPTIIRIDRESVCQ